MSFEGMDVDLVRHLAAQLDANAQALARITAVLAGFSQELVHYWHGPAAATFQYEWTARHHAGLGNAAQALSDMHARLIANIEQQESASAAAGAAGTGATGGTGLAGGVVAGAALTAILGGIGRGWDGLLTGAGWEGLVQTPLDKIREVAGPADVPDTRGGRIVAEDYGTMWTQVNRLDHDGPFLKYKESPVINWLHDNAHVQRAGEILGGTHSAAVLDKLDGAGKGLGYLSTGVTGFQSLDDLRHHEYGAAAGKAVDGASGALMNSDNPALFLAGFDTALIKKDYELAQQIDWKQGIPNPLNASNFRNDYIPTFKALPGQLASTLAEII